MTDETPTPAVEQELWTVRKVLDWTIEHLKKYGSESPRLDAEILLAQSRGCQRIQLYTEYDAPLLPEERVTMRALVTRRASLEPVAYLVGHREFFGIDFEVGPGVLIPLPDTETLVVKSLEIAKSYREPRVLDLCTGSGCVAVSIAKNSRSAAVTAIELDETAFGFARRNIDKHALAERVDLRRGDLFGPIHDDEQFEIIASNPPYVTDAEMDTIQPDVRLHEPHLALRGGTDGLDIVRRLINDAPQHLVSGGALLLEIASQQAQTVVALLAANGNFEQAEIEKDLAGSSRVVWVKRSR